jgi:integrase
MSDLIEQFKREYQDYHRITEKRAREQRQHLGALELRMDGRSLVEVTAEDFAGFLAELAQTRQPNTVRKIGNMIRPFFNWAHARGYVDDGRIRQLRAVKDPRGAARQCRPKPYSRKELAEFWAMLSERLPLLPDKGAGSKLLGRWIVGKTEWRRVARHAMRLQVEAVVALALHCGLRRAEIFNLTPDELHYDNEYVVVRGKADPNTGEPKIRAVPFTEPARDAVRSWLDFRELMRPTHGKTWLSCFGPHTYADPMSFDRFEELLGKVVGPGWTLHRFRHTFATERLRAGTPLEIVSEALGHSNLEQTRAYAEIARQDMTREMQKTEDGFVSAVRPTEVVV